MARFGVVCYAKTRFLLSSELTEGLNVNTQTKTGATRRRHLPATRVTTAELNAIRNDARLSGVSVSEYIRRAIYEYGGRIYEKMSHI